MKHQRIIQNFEVILEPEDDMGYHVFCPALKGCHSYGATKEEAMEKIKEAIALWLESARDQEVFGKMFDIKKEYVVTDDNKKKAVLIDIETFERIEEILESYGLGKYMEEIEGEAALSIDEARSHYKKIR